MKAAEREVIEEIAEGWIYPEAIEKVFGGLERLHKFLGVNESCTPRELAEAADSALLPPLIKPRCPECSSSDVVEIRSLRTAFPVVGVVDGQPETGPGRACADSEFDTADPEFECFRCEACDHEAAGITAFVVERDETPDAD